MLCEKCGKKPAVVKFNQVVNNEKTSHCICEDCAMEMMGSHLSFGTFDPFSAFSGFFQNTMVNRPSDALCPSCGTTYRRFLDTGKFGCAHCYEAFEKQLGAVFRKIHNSAEYKGKLPDDARLHLKRSVSPEEELAERIREAVEKEDYESAAALKKHLDAMKKGEEK